MIKQIIENKKVQTDMAVQVDGIIIRYRREQCGIKYEFCVGIGDGEGLAPDCRTATEKVLQVVHAMEEQSRKVNTINCTFWQMKKLEEEFFQVQKYGQFYVRVVFRILSGSRCTDGIL